MWCGVVGGWGACSACSMKGREWNSCTLPSSLGPVLSPCLSRRCPLSHFPFYTSLGMHTSLWSHALTQLAAMCVGELLLPRVSLQSFDAEFVKVDQSTLFDLILAANYLNIKGLLDLTCQTVAQMIKGKTPEVRGMGRFHRRVCSESVSERPEYAGAASLSLSRLVSPS